LGAEARKVPTMHCGPNGDCTGSCPALCEYCTCEPPWCICTHNNTTIVGLGQPVELKQEPLH
jgi:hypothetical protein